MTIALLTSFHPSPTLQSQSVPDETDRVGNGDCFAQLLATMLDQEPVCEEMAERGASALPAPFRPAAASSVWQAQRAVLECSPPIGSSSVAFEQGQLLVETACDLSQAARAFLTTRQSDGSAEMPSAASAISPPSPVPPGSKDSLNLPPAEWTIGQALPFSPNLTVTGATAVLHPAPKHSATTLQSVQITPSSVSAQNVPAAPVEAEPAAEPGGSVPAPPPRNPAASSERFSARLVAVDGALRLLLRLPHLDDGERTQMEVGLARLFASFGHRRHDIVIRETGRG